MIPFNKNLYFLFLLMVTVSLVVVPSISSSSKTTTQLAFAQPTAGTNTNGKHPNILAIMGDDFGFSDLGSFGSEISTPNLDAIAKDGKILTNYHTMPVCSPARVSFLTGVDNHVGGIGTMYENIAPNQVDKPGYETYINNRVVTVAELLRDAGYHTLMSGKWHLSGSGAKNGTFPSDRGFEDVFSLLESGAMHFNGDPYYAGGHSTFVRNGKVVPRPDNRTYSNDLYTNIMLDQIKKNHSDGKPLAMYLSYQVAHSPFQAPQDYIKKYQGVYNVGYDKIREQRFEKQKELGIWHSNMTLPKRLPPIPTWDGLDPQTKADRAKTLAVHAAMIDNMDYNIGKVVSLLKELEIYNNTLIIFTSDNGSSEPFPATQLATTGVTVEQAKAFSDKFNNTLSNIGNANSLVNYADWGTLSSVSPFSYFKATQGEGGIRPPFIIKAPLAASATTTTTNQTHPKIIDAFVRVSDMTPTMLDYEGVQPAGPTYKGHPVHPIMGKSIKPLLEGKVTRVYPDDEPVAQEMFNNTAVFMGPWKAEKLFGPPLSDGKWHLYDIRADIGENTDLASQHPEILQKMMSAYDKFAKDVGVIVPSGIGAAALEKLGLGSD
jgi:arylsulfatase A-like enzyme